MPLRLLARAAPIVLGAVAAAIWLRRRRAARPALPVRAGPAPPAPALPDPAPAGPAPPAPAPPAPVPAGPAPPVLSPAAAPSPAAARSRPASVSPRRSTRFVRASERRPIDIVTVVDDLLDTTR